MNEDHKVIVVVNQQVRQNSGCLEGCLFCVLAILFIFVGLPIILFGCLGALLGM